MARLSETWFSMLNLWYFLLSMALIATRTPEILCTPFQTGLQEPSPMDSSIAY